MAHNHHHQQQQKHHHHRHQHHQWLVPACLDRKLSFSLSTRLRRLFQSSAHLRVVCSPRFTEHRFTSTDHSSWLPLHLLHLLGRRNPGSERSSVRLLIITPCEVSKHSESPIVLIIAETKVCPVRHLSRPN